MNFFCFMPCQMYFHASCFIMSQNYTVMMMVKLDTHPVKLIMLVCGAKVEVVNFTGFHEILQMLE
jgi:hypothetical protein